MNIDHLKKIIESNSKTMTAWHDSEQEIFQEFFSFLDFHVRKYWKDEEKEAFEKYTLKRHSLLHMLRDRGWCVQCRSHESSCTCAEDS